MRAAVRAELLQFETIGVVPTILLGDVIAVLALNTGQGDLGPDIGGLRGHWSAFQVRSVGLSIDALVAMAGLEPATQRL